MILRTIGSLTRNCVYETLCPQPFACQPSFLPGNLQIILYKPTISVATSCYSFRDIFITSFLCPNLQRAISHKNIFFLNIPSDNPLIILYQLIKFEAHSYDKIADYLISLWPFKRDITPQREIIQIKKYGSVIFDEESTCEISRPYLKGVRAFRGYFGPL